MLKTDRRSESFPPKESEPMSPAYLVTEEVRREDGVSPSWPVPDADTLRITVGITRIVEQESLDVVIEGAPANEENWRPLLYFARKFYCGEYSQSVQRDQVNDIDRLRVRWRISRWHNSGPQPLFQFYVTAEEAEVPMAMAAAASR
ncbi:MAG: hypothetical protein R2729_12255 [Bryobacteraceae bacterium]